MDKLNWVTRACGIFLLWATAAIALPAQTTGDGPPAPIFTLLYSFGMTGDGASPYAGLAQGTDGNFYGTTFIGGAYGSYGTVFKITPRGKLTTLHSFDGTDGDQPAGLVLAIDGNFYGTTEFGGANSNGTVFKITSSGALTTLHSFDRTDGAGPYDAGLVQATDGNFYGTTYQGGADDYGTVFKITPRGKLTTLHSFSNADGSFPRAGLVQGTDGNFYGTTQEGGAVGSCGDGCGTVFRITPGGTLTTLHSFDLTDGEYPLAGLVQGTNGTFYGTADCGGAYGPGCGPYYPGTVFSLSVGLGPFVETLPAFGKVGTPVHILGTNLTGTTSVTFDGTPATFTVVSKTLIFTNVPAGATTGTVQVATPSGPLSNNVPFQVNP